jgi:hypothetical protein
MPNARGPETSLYSTEEDMYREDEGSQHRMDQRIILSSFPGARTY